MPAPITWLTAALTCLSLALGASAQTPNSSEPGLYLVMDYSGSMWEPTRERDPANPARLRPAPGGNAGDHHSIHDRAEALALNLFDQWAAQFGGFFRMMTFGENGSGCGDITRQTGLGDRLAPQTRGRLARFLERTRPRGTTPLQEATISAIEDSRALVTEARTDRMHIIILTDMKDICIGGQIISNPTPEEYCEVGTDIRGALERANRIILEERGILDSIRLEFIVSLSPNSHNAVEVTARCAKTETYKPESDEDTPPTPAPDPIPSVELTVTAGPAQMRDALGRTIPLLPGALSLRDAATGAALNKAKLSGSGTRFEQARGTPARVALNPAQGVGQEAGFDFAADGAVRFDLRLPRLTLELRDAEGGALRGPVIWRIRDTRDGTERAIRRDGATANFDLPAGRYEIEASELEGPVAVLRLELGRDDLSRSLQPDTPPPVVSVELPFRVSRIPPDVELGAMPEVEVLVTSAAGRVRVAEAAGQLTLDVDQNYDIALQMGGTVILEERSVPVVAGSAPPDITFSLVPPRVLGADSEWGAWDISRIDMPGNTRINALSLEVSLHPGRYTIRRNGAGLCAEGSAIVLGYGDVLALEDPVDWPMDEACQ